MATSLMVAARNACEKQKGQGDHLYLVAIVAALVHISDLILHQRLRRALAWKPSVCGAAELLLGDAEEASWAVCTSELALPSPTGVQPPCVYVSGRPRSGCQSGRVAYWVRGLIAKCVFAPRHPLSSATGLHRRRDGKSHCTFAVPSWMGQCRHPPSCRFYTICWDALLALRADAERRETAEGAAARRVSFFARSWTIRATRPSHGTTGRPRPAVYTRTRTVDSVHDKSGRDGPGQTLEHLEPNGQRRLQALGVDTTLSDRSALTAYAVMGL